MICGATLCLFPTSAAAKFCLCLLLLVGGQFSCLCLSVVVQGPGPKRVCALSHSEVSLASVLKQWSVSWLLYRVGNVSDPCITSAPPAMGGKWKNLLSLSSILMLCCIGGKDQESAWHDSLRPPATSPTVLLWRVLSLAWLYCFFWWTQHKEECGEKLVRIRKLLLVWKFPVILNQQACPFCCRNSQSSCVPSVLRGTCHSGIQFIWFVGSRWFIPLWIVQCIITEVQRCCSYL